MGNEEGSKGGEGVFVEKNHSIHTHEYHTVRDSMNTCAKESYRSSSVHFVIEVQCVTVIP